MIMGSHTHQQHK